MTSQTENWTYAEFRAFCMLYAANADGEITVDEKNLIQLSLASVEEYTRIKSIFMACDDMEALNIILSYREKYCSTQADKDRVLADMLKVFHADASFEQIERGVHQLFKRML
jgi:hypothetical protein